MDVTDSDHKPVRCIFTLDIARVDESIRRQELGEILESNGKIKCMLEELCKIPETIVSTNNIILQNQDTSILRITNKCGKKDALFEIICEGQSIIKEDGHASDHCPRGSFGFPRWLEVISYALEQYMCFPIQEICLYMHGSLAIEAIRNEISGTVSCLSHVICRCHGICCH